MSSINVVTANATITTTGTTQALDPHAPQLLSFVSFDLQAASPPLTVTAKTTNAAIIYVSNSPTASAGVGFPLQPGKSISFRAPSTGGLFVNGTAGDGYGFVSGTAPRSSASGGSAGPTPLAQWKMGEGSGTTFVDSAGGNNATASATSWGTRTGFPGSINQFATAAATGISPYKSSLAFTATTPFSISIWAAWNGTGECSLIGNLNDTTNAYTGWDMFLDGANGALNFDLFANYTANNIASITIPSSLITSSTVSNHLVATYNGGSQTTGMFLYLNGVVQTPTATFNALSGSITNTNNGVCLGGRFSGGSTFNGGLCDARLYAGALTQAQISTIYAAGPA